MSRPARRCAGHPGSTKSTTLPLRWPLALLLCCITATAAMRAQAPATPTGPAAQPQTPAAPAGGADWAQLRRFHDDDAQLPPPRAGEQRVVFLGDSIMEGWGRQPGHFFPGRPYINRGISGQTTPQMLVRFQQDVVALHPAAVLILAGINDIAGNTGPETLEDIENNFRAMADIAEREHIRVILASTLPAAPLPWKPAVRPMEEIRQLNRWLKELARERHLTFCDYYPALADSDGAMRPELASDRAVHPNEAGYARMQPIAEAAIQAALQLPRP